MFGFFKKKGINKSPVETRVQPQKPLSDEAKTMLAVDDVELLADVMFKGNAHAGVYVAQCGGFPLGPLDTSRFSEYWRLVLIADPHDFSQEDKRNASRYRIKEFISTLNSEYSLLDYSGHPRADRLDQIKRAVRDVDISAESFEALGIDNVAKAILRTAMRKKQFDLERVILELRGREEYVRATFLPLQRNRMNKYGDNDLTDEINEVDEFIDHFFDRETFDYFYTVSPASLIVHYIDSMLEGAKVQDDIPPDGIAFEHWCAGQIQAQGWAVSLSKASGDQGVDIVAVRGAKRVAIQCKRYTNPIGNKAVQEAFTGAQNVDAGESLVLGTGGFTASAKAIAAKTGVHLLDASNIGSFSTIFGFEAMTNNDSFDEIVDSDETMLQFRLSGVGGGFVGTLLRSALKSSSPENYGLCESVGVEFLENVDKDTGFGSVNVTSPDMAMLLIIAAQGIKTIVEVSGENLNSMKSSPYYDDEALDRCTDGVAMIEDIIHQEVLQSVYSFLFDIAKSMGPLFNDYLEDKLSEVLFDTSG